MDVLVYLPLLDTQHAKNQTPHRFSTAKLTTKQQIKLRSPIKDVNEQLSEIPVCFDPLHPLFSPGSRLVNHFSSRIVFHSPTSSDDDGLHKHMSILDNAFCYSQITSLILDEMS